MKFCPWITGLPGSGKTTIANELQAILSRAEEAVVLLSLDDLRKVLTPEPRYTPEERERVYRALALMAGFSMRTARRA